MNRVLTIHVKYHDLLSMKNKMDIYIYLKMLSAVVVIGALTLSMLGKIFSRRHFEIFVLHFTENRF